MRPSPVPLTAVRSRILCHFGAFSPESPASTTSAWPWRSRAGPARPRQPTPGGAETRRPVHPVRSKGLLALEPQRLVEELHLEAEQVLGDPLIACHVRRRGQGKKPVGPSRFQQGAGEAQGVGGNDVVVEQAVDEQ